MARVATHLAIRKLIVDLENEIARRKEYEAELERMATVDPLTNIYNRRFFFERSEEELERSKRYTTPLSLILFDIDHFKQVNDTHGHLVGDQVLANLAALCQDAIRSVDILARYGGEEFIILMPDSTIAAAYNAAERLREQVATTNLTDGQINLTTTISLGVSSWDNEEATDLKTLIDQADQALYHSKESGRNRVTVWGEY